MKFKIDALLPEPERRLTDQEYHFCYQRTPRACFDAIIVREHKILLAKRKIEPYIGYWSLPGGGIRYKEPIIKAAERILVTELGLRPVSMRAIGNIEFLNDASWVHSISMAHLVTLEPGKIRGSEQADEFGFFLELPENVLSVQGKFLSEYWTIVMT